MSMQDEQITDQQVTSEENQAPESSTQGQPQNVDGLPEKFTGKSAAEIAQAYSELEKDRGRLASEVGNLRKEQENAEHRFRMLEQAVARTQLPHPVQDTRQAQPDPFAALEKLEENPKEAITQALKGVLAISTQQSNRTADELRQNEAAQYYHSQKQANPDYARREPIMQELLSQFSDVIKPEYRNSKKILEALDLMSRGRDVEYYKQEAVANVAKNGSSLRDEKRRAQSDSGSGGGESRLDYSKMSSKQLAAHLKRSDD